MEIKGKIIAKFTPIRGVSKAGKEYAKQEFVIETLDRYPKKVCFSIWGSERVEKFKGEVGDTATIKFDIDSRENGGRWYTTLNAYAIDIEPIATPAPTATTVATGATYEQLSQQFQSTNKDAESDLPF